MRGWRSAALAAALMIVASTAWAQYNNNSATGTAGYTDNSGTGVKVLGRDGNGKMYVLPMDQNGNVRTAEQSQPGNFSILSTNVFTTVLQFAGSADSRTQSDSVVVSLQNYPGWSHYGLFFRARPNTGSTVLSQDSVMAVVFGLQVWASPAAAIDTLSAMVGAWMRGPLASPDTIGSLQSAYWVDNSTAIKVWQTLNLQYERQIVVQLGTNGSLGTTRNNVPLYGEFVPLRVGSGDEQGFASNIGLRLILRTVYLDNPAKSAAATNATSGCPWSVACDLVGWR